MSFGSGNFEDDDFCSGRTQVRNVVPGMFSSTMQRALPSRNMLVHQRHDRQQEIFNDKWSREVRNENDAKILTLKNLGKAEVHYNVVKPKKRSTPSCRKNSNASKENRFYYARIFH
jgi:hypothetical protein